MTATGLRPAARGRGNSRRGRLAGAWAVLLIAALAPASARGGGPAAPLGSPRPAAERGRPSLAAPGSSGDIARDPGRVGSEARKSLPDPRTLCYAFLRGRGLGSGADFAYRQPVRLWVSCGYQRSAVSGAPGPREFAVASNRMVLAVADRSGRVRAFSLRSPFRELAWHGPTGALVTAGGLQPTCGTIAAWSSRGLVDGLTGKNIPTRAYGRAVCSADRRVLAGVTRAGLLAAERAKELPAGGLTLYVDGQRAGATTPHFALSPDGAYVAWISPQGDAPVCAEHVGRRHPVCAPFAEIGWAADGADSLRSVGNDGSVIFGGSSWANGCPWCSSVYYWTPRMAAAPPVLLEPAGADPQWITPAAAQALIARYKYLLAHRKHPARRGPRGGE